MRIALASICVALLAAAAAPAGTPIPSFRHVVVVVFENKEIGAILGNPSAPTFNSMARRYATMTRYYGVTHPSLPNYLVLVSGSTQGISSDCTSCTVNATNLADSLETAWKTWKLYAEGLPRAGFTGPFAGRYAKKHAPFLYFRDVFTNLSRLHHIVPLTALRRDLKASTLPDYALVVPDLCHSMHDCSVRTGDTWLRGQLPPLLRLPETVVFVVFDEGTTDARGGGHIAALALGTAVRPRSRYRGVTSHYGLLRTIEDAWGLPPIGVSDQSPITGIWR